VSKRILIADSDKEDYTREFSFAEIANADLVFQKKFMLLEDDYFILIKSRQPICPDYKMLSDNDVAAIIKNNI